MYHLHIKFYIDIVLVILYHVKLVKPQINNTLVKHLLKMVKLVFVLFDLLDLFILHSYYLKEKWLKHSLSSRITFKQISFVKLNLIKLAI